MNIPVIRKLKLSVPPLRTPSFRNSIASYPLTEFSLKLKTDYGPSFQSQSFAKFAQYMGFHHRKITPAWPKANSESQSFMRTLNKTLRAAHLENKNWQQVLFLFLRNYLATPLSTTGISPAELLFGPKLGTKLPELIKTALSRSLIADADTRQKAKIKAYVETRSKAQHRTLQIGDTVLVREERKHKLSSPTTRHPIP